MESKSSAHFEALNMEYSEVHNKRLFVHNGALVDNSNKNIDLSFLPEKYFVEKEKEFFVKGGAGKKELVKFLGVDYDAIFSDVKNNYKNATGKDWKNRKGPGVGKTELFKEMEVNTKSTTSKADLIKLKDKLEGFGISVMEMSLHNDEGDIKEDGAIKYNHHLHITFVNCDENGTVKRWQKGDLKRLQDVVAEVLQMERGQPSNKKHISAMEYKRIAAEREKLENEVLHLNNKLKDANKNNAVLKQENNKLNKLLNTQDIKLNDAKTKATKQSNEISEFKALFEALGLDEIVKSAQTPKEIKKKLLDQIKQDYDDARQELKKSGTATKEDYSDLKKDDGVNKENINELFELLGLSEIKKKNIDDIKKVVSNKNNSWVFGGTGTFAMAVETINDEIKKIEQLRQKQINENNKQVINNNTESIKNVEVIQKEIKQIIKKSNDFDLDI